MTAAPRILLVEDEPAIGEGLRVNLVEDGYEVEWVTDGSAALRRARVGGFDLLILDVMLPGLDGLAVCAGLRAVDPHTPVLFLSALGEPPDRVAGLRAGGDDYLPKPFDLNELLLRTRALLRRRGRDAAPLIGRDVLRLGAREVHLQSGEVHGPDGVRRLGEKEMRLLRFLAARRGQVVRRGEILDVVWGADADPTERTVDNFIVRLRRVLGDDPGRPRWLHTHRGLGYRLTLVPEDGP